MSAAALIADCQKRLDRLRGGGGWFTSGGSSIDHGTYRSVIAQYHDRVYHEGRVAWGALVQANEGLYTQGDWDSTGALVYSFDRHFDANPNMLERIAASVGALKNNMPKDPLLVAFAAEVRNDQPREIDRLAPVALTQGRQVRYETVYIQRHRLPTGYLAGQFFPIIISTSQPTQPMVLPLDAWTPELVALWQTAQRSKPASRPISRERPPIGGQPQRYHEDPYLASPAPPTASPGLSFGSNAPRQPAAPATYGNTGYGNSGGYGNTSGYGTSNGQGSSGAYGGQQQPSYGGGNTSGQNYSSGSGYVPSVAAQPAFVQPPPAPPPPAPRLDPAVEAFAQKPLQLTASAAGSLKLSAGQAKNPFKVRVSVAENNVHRLDFVNGEANPTTDFVYDSAGVTLVVDVNSARALTGVQVDFGPSPNGIGFVFRRVA